MRNPPASLPHSWQYTRGKGGVDGSVDRHCTVAAIISAPPAASAVARAHFSDVARSDRPACARRPFQRSDYRGAETTMFSRVPPTISTSCPVTRSNARSPGMNVQPKRRSAHGAEWHSDANERTRAALFWRTLSRFTASSRFIPVTSRSTYSARSIGPTSTVALLQAGDYRGNWDAIERDAITPRRRQAASDGPRGDPPILKGRGTRHERPATRGA